MGIKRHFEATLMVFGIAVLASCGPQVVENGDLDESRPHATPDAVQISQVWARRTLVPDQPTGVYLTIQNATQVDVRLLRVTAKGAARSEMHDNLHDNGVVRMIKLDELLVPTGTTVEFRPGGKHIMVFGLPQLLEPGMRLPLILGFEHANDLEVDAIVSADMNAPAMADHHGQ
jgi:copper(I)-binding protein